MSGLDELAITMGKLGEGPWELTLEDGETVEVELDEVDVTERHGFEAAGRNEFDDPETEDRLVELSTGIQPGGAIHLKRRPLSADDWRMAGEVVDATKLDRP